MPPTQDPTPPTKDSMPRLHWRDMYPRPMRWFCEIDLSLCIVSFITAKVSPSDSAWPTVGLLLVILFLSVYLAVPGALVAMGHPWGDFFLKLWGRRYAHPRRVGLASVWLALIMSGITGATLFLLHTRLFNAADGVKWLLIWSLAFIAAFLLAVAPILALYGFDRRLPK